MSSLTESKRAEYFEGVLQLRDCEQEVIDFAEKEIDRLKLTIAKTVEFKNGKDYFLPDNNLTKRIGKKLQSKYGGEYLVTATLHTKKQIPRHLLTLRQKFYKYRKNLPKHANQQAKYPKQAKNQRQSQDNEDRGGSIKYCQKPYRTILHNKRPKA